MKMTVELIPVDSIHLFDDGIGIQHPWKNEERVELFQEQRSHELLRVMCDKDGYMLLSDQDEIWIYKHLGYQSVLACVYHSISREEQIELIHQQRLSREKPPRITKKMKKVLLAGLAQLEA